jgi:hypothetical protein
LERGVRKKECGKGESRKKGGNKACSIYIQQEQECDSRIVKSVTVMWKCFFLIKIKIRFREKSFIFSPLYFVAFLGEGEGRAEQRE